MLHKILEITEMPQVMLYCRDGELRQDLESGLGKMGCDSDTCQDQEHLMSRVLEDKPDVLVLCLRKAEKWVPMGIGTFRRVCPQTKIIYATQNPGANDVKSLEHGIFYYAGNAPANDILEAVKAALGAKS
ncbi:MAG: hypothetical protein HY402_05370 [Elusimicrobia bacterium]|nr:hypothetical protein [Elusimicrobiota bacterium]